MMPLLLSADDYWACKRAYAEEDAEVRRQAEALAQHPSFQHEVAFPLRPCAFAVNYASLYYKDVVCSTVCPT